MNNITDVQMGALLAVNVMSTTLDAASMPLGMRKADSAVDACRHTIRSFPPPSRSEKIWSDPEGQVEAANAARPRCALPPVPAASLKGHYRGPKGHFRQVANLNCRHLQIAKCCPDHGQTVSYCMCMKRDRHIIFLRLWHLRFYLQ